MELCTSFHKSINTVPVLVNLRTCRGSSGTEPKTSGSQKARVVHPMSKIAADDSELWLDKQRARDYHEGAVNPGGIPLRSGYILYPDT